MKLKAGNPELRTGLYTLYTTSNVQAKPHSLHLDSDDRSISLLPWHFTCYPVSNFSIASTFEELSVPLFVVRIVFCRAIEGACEDEGGPCNDGPHTGKVPTKASNAASLYVCTWVSGQHSLSWPPTQNPSWFLGTNRLALLVLAMKHHWYSNSILIVYSKCTCDLQLHIMQPCISFCYQFSASRALQSLPGPSYFQILCLSIWWVVPYYWIYIIVYINRCTSNHCLRSFLLKNSKSRKSFQDLPSIPYSIWHQNVQQVVAISPSSVEPLANHVHVADTLPGSYKHQHPATLTIRRTLKLQAMLSWLGTKYLGCTKCRTLFGPEQMGSWLTLCKHETRTGHMLRNSHTRRFQLQHTCQARTPSAATPVWMSLVPSHSPKTGPFLNATVTSCIIHNITCLAERDLCVVQVIADGFVTHVLWYQASYPYPTKDSSRYNG